MLVGNKADKDDRVVSTEEGEELAKAFGVREERVSQEIVAAKLGLGPAPLKS